MTDIEQTSSHPPSSPTAVGGRQGLALPIELEEGAPPAIFKNALYVISILLIGLVLWSSIAQVREISSAPGEISPSSAIRKVAHLEGGIVDNINVKLGTQIRKGDTLMSLRPESADGGFSQIAARQADLRIRTERLSAQANGRAPNFDAFSAQWPSLVSEQRTLFEAAEEQHFLDMQSYMEREASAKAELQGAIAALKESKELVGLAQEQLSIQNDLIEGGFTSRQAFLEAKSALATARSNLASSETRVQQARTAYNGTVAEKERAQATYRTTASEQRAQAVAELLELEQRYVISEDRDDRLTIRAPVGGIVNNIVVEGQGDVVRPGEVILQIVPTGTEMVADVRVSPKDIGHIKLGQDAEITVTTFDPKRYGTLIGTISRISPDTFVDERTGEPYYKVNISVDQTDEDQLNLVSKLSPGMEVSVRITTHTRSLMAYMLKPVVRSLDQAFSER
ncbi:MAG: HlyD family type I secretion periplasmic adaptor subunit [Pseudomonadota bacterium]